MKNLLKNEIISYVREPFAFFFSIILPIGLVFLYGESFGKYGYNEVMNGYDLSLVFNLIFLLANLGCMGLVQGIVEKKVSLQFKREAVLPLTNIEKFILNIFSTILLAFIISLVVIIINYLIYDISININPMFIIVYLIILFNFFSFGYIVALINTSPKTVQTIGLFFFFVFMFLSGLIIPFDDSPSWVRIISKFSPFNVSLEVFSSTFDLNNFNDYMEGWIALLVYTCINIFAIFKNRKVKKWR